MGRTHLYACKIKGFYLCLQVLRVQKTGCPSVWGVYAFGGSVLPPNATSNGGDASRVGKIYSYYLLVEFVFPYILYSAGRVAPISVCVFLQRVFKQLKNASKWSRQKVYFERPACKGKSITILCALEFYQAIIISILHHSYARFISPLSPRQAGAVGVAAVWGAPWQCRFARRRSCSGRRAAGWGGSPFQFLAPR